MALTEGMIDLVVNRGVDVVNMSIGGLPALNDGDNARAEQLMIAHIDALASRLDESLVGRGGARNRLRSILAPEDPASSK